MEDIARLEALYAFAQEKNLLPRLRLLRAGDLALEILPEPPSPPSVAALPDQPPDPRSEERRNLEALLWSSGSEVSPFLGETQ